ncbi:MAG: phosphoribosylformylglycinamidine synthase subunit PurL [Candidatus Nezhaarchaeota archaeon]|nr:phosphoribosylformylglycinamidine synthase subunit PurL [Candidatus Nezhaarchaeota archaeon]
MRVKGELYIRQQGLPFDLFLVNIVEADDGSLVKISEEMGLALSLEEMRAVKAHYQLLGRLPTDVELQTIGQTWSEHCYHKTFKGVVEAEGRRVKSLLKTYIAKVVRELKPSWCVSVFEDNAGIVDFGEGYAVAIKVETHNHPSAIEPFGGAATGIGGVIRDILGVWGDPIANIDVLCFGPLDYPYEKLPRGVKHPRYLYRGVVAGIGHYGNNMGIPTVCGAIHFDEGYVGNVVVYCGCVGLLPIEKYVKKAKPGDYIVLAGGRTGRDGIHGVTFASAELTEKSEEVSRPAVQIPNPIEEERLKRAILRIRDGGYATAITDLGGGGVSCAVGETAHRFRLGAHVWLEKVPLKYPGMAPWEIWVSESQERMLLVSPPDKVGLCIEAFSDEEVEAVAIGRLDDTGLLKVDYAGYRVAELDLGFLFNPPPARRVAAWTPPSLEEPPFNPPADLSDALLALLASPNVCSKEEVIRTYDHEVKGATVVKPLQGMRAGPNDAAVLKPLPNSWRGVAISCGIKPRYGKIDPYWMAASAIDEAIRNNVAVGGRRIALLDNFTWGNPEKPDRMGGLLRAVRACYRFAKAFGAPFVSGKDSLYNESPLGPVTPTLLITALGIVPDVRSAVTSDLKRPGDVLYIVGYTRAELGGSEYYALRGLLGSSVPRVYMPTARLIVSRLTEAIDRGLVRACHDLSEGGLGVAAAEMAIGGGLGVELYLPKVPRPRGLKRDDFVLFSESNTRFLVEVEEDVAEEFSALFRGLPHAEVGRVVGEPRIAVYGVGGRLVADVTLLDAERAWKRRL